MSAGFHPGSRSPNSRRSAAARASNALLVLLCGWLLWGAWRFDRASWPSFVGDEATYLMAAESLAWDFDLRYERLDFDRFTRHWRLPPEGLILQSGDGGVHITYGKPFFYPLFLAPFVRLSPTRGPFVANAMLLAVVALVAVCALRSRLGPWTALWVSAFLFASVSFAYVFWAHADLFLLASTAIALGLAFWRPVDEETGGGITGRWLLIGLLLAVAIYSRPFYLPLLLPALLARPRRDGRRAALALLGAALAVAAIASVIHRVNADAWTSYGAQRRGFYSTTGFPDVDFPASEWRRSVEDLGDAAWGEARSLLSPPPVDAALWGWNSLYFLVGRQVGVLPYFLPLLLGFCGRPQGVARWSLVLAVMLCAVAFFLYRPFNFYGGGGAIGNRYFMPLFPAFWFLVQRRSSPLWVLLIGLGAAPFLWPLWTSPRAYPQRPDRTYRYVSTAAQRWLPYETTQSHLKPGGRSDVTQGGLWIKFLSTTLRPSRTGDSLLLDRGSRGELLLGNPTPLRRLELRTLADPIEALRLRGARIVEARRLAPGGVAMLRPDRLRARHPMWWTWNDVFLYRLSVESLAAGEGRLPFTLSRVPTLPDSAPE